MTIPTATGTAEFLAHSRRLVEPNLRAAIDTLHPDVAAIASYHLGWTDQHGNSTKGATGKRIRSTLALLSAASVSADPSTAVSGAIALELVHEFSLLHDDIMDMTAPVAAGQPRGSSMAFRRFCSPATHSSPKPCRSLPKPARQPR